MAQRTGHPRHKRLGQGRPRWNLKITAMRILTDIDLFDCVNSKRQEETNEARPAKHLPPNSQPRFECQVRERVSNVLIRTLPTHGKGKRYRHCALTSLKLKRSINSTLVLLQLKS